MNVSNVMKALVVEDQELFRDAVADELNFLGFKTMTAVDGEDGLSIFQKTHFDLILSDMRMPKRDGQWFLRELRKISKSSPPFIFMTGFTDLSPREAFDMGADGFVAKPLDTERLEVLIAKVCRPIEGRWMDRPSVRPNLTIAKHIPSPPKAGLEAQFLLGRGGMFLAYEHPTLKIGERVAFNLTIEQGPVLKLEGVGTIMWRQGLGESALQVGYGIDFEYITPETLPSLLAVLKSMDTLAVIPKGQLKG